MLIFFIYTPLFLKIQIPLYYPPKVTTDGVCLIPKRSHIQIIYHIRWSSQKSHPALFIGG
jgi:hypothetical protein